MYLSISTQCSRVSLQITSWLGRSCLLDFGYSGLQLFASKEFLPSAMGLHFAFGNSKQLTTSHFSKWASSRGSFELQYTTRFVTNLIRNSRTKEPRLRIPSASVGLSKHHFAWLAASSRSRGKEELAKHFEFLDLQKAFKLLSSSGFWIKVTDLLVVEQRLQALARERLEILVFIEEVCVLALALV